MLPGDQPPATNVPESRDSFIGRVSDIRRLGAVLGMGTRLVTVKGAGGIGKTRLCQHYGRKNVAMYPGGVWFVELAGARTRADMLRMVAVVLQVTLTGAEAGGDAVDQVGDALAQRGPLLLILDNVEQMTEAASSLVAQWMSRTDHTQFLVTSRHPLQVQGEMVFVLKSLAGDDGVQLFRERARMSGAAWVDRSVNTQGLERLTQPLDGLPLAIELVAARANQFSLSGLQALLEAPHKLLTTQRRDRPPRQHTVADLIQWSWKLLQPWEQEALLQISVFRGGFELDAARAVVSLSRWPEAPWTPDVIGRLLDHSLLFMGNAEQQRYQMYTSVRSFCEHRRASSPEHEALIVAAGHRHAAFFAAFGDQDFTARLGQHGGEGLRKRLHRELDNLTAAVAFSIDAGCIERAARCALGCATIYELQGPHHVGVSILKRIVAVYPDPSTTRARVLRTLAYMEFLMGDFEGAAKNYENGYRDTKQCSPEDEPAAHIWFLHDIARVYFSEGKLQLAVDCHEKIITGCREQENAVGLMSGLINQSDLQFLLGDFEPARQSIHEGLRIARQVGSRRSELVCLMNFAEIDLAKNDAEAAIPLIEQAKNIAQENEDSKNTGILLGLLGEAYALGSDTEKGIALLQQALHHHAASMPTRDTIRYRGALAVLLAQRGDTETPRTMLEHGMVQYETLPKLSLIRLLCQMAQVEHHLSGVDRARSLLGQAMALAQPLELSVTAPIHALLRATKQLVDPAQGTPPALTTDAQGTWFRLAGGEVTWLVRRKALRQIFAALVHAHQASPGAGLSLDELIAAGWGDEHILEEARRARVYTAVSSLRRLGLGKRLQRKADGYKLDPSLVVVLAAQPPSQR